MNTAERVTKILDMLALEGPCGISDLSRELCMGKNNVLKILADLEALGWVHLEIETKKYGLTGNMVAVAIKALTQLEIGRISLPYLYELQQATTETSTLSIRVELERIFINCISSNQAIRHVVNPGERRPLWSGSGGRAMLAFMDDTDVEKVLDQFKQSTGQIQDEDRYISVESIREDLIQIRKQGFALTNGHVDLEIFGASAPIFNYNQELVGCINISGPASRFTKEKTLQYSTLLVEKAKKISSIMGAKLE